MKYIENNKTWDLVVKVLEKVYDIPTDENCDSEEIKYKCCSLAEYTYENDIKTGSINKSEIKKKRTRR